MRRAVPLILAVLVSTSCVFYDTASVTLAGGDAATEADHGGSDGSMSADSSSPGADMPAAPADMNVTDLPSADMTGGQDMTVPPDAGPGDMGPDMPPPSDPFLSTSVWLRSDEGITLVNGEAIEWVDRRNGNKWTPPAIPRRPTVVDGAHNGLPVLRFFGGQELRLETGFVDLDDWTMFVAFKRAETDREGSVVSTHTAAHGDTNFQLGTTPTALSLSSSTAGFALSNTIASTLNYQLLEVHAAGGDLRVLQNRAQTASATYTKAGPVRISAIGAFRDASFFRGDLLEIIMWNRALTEPDRVVVRNYFTGRYGL